MFLLTNRMGELYEYFTGNVKSCILDQMEMQLAQLCYLYNI